MKKILFVINTLGGPRGTGAAGASDEIYTGKI